MVKGLESRASRMREVPHRMTTLAKAALMVVALVCASVPSAADVNPSAVLAGRWEGEVQMAGGTYPRTLIIRTVPDAARGSLIVAEFGGGGSDYGGLQSGIAPVNLRVEAYGNDVLLRFSTPEAWLVELALYKDQRHLFGAMRIPISRGGAWGINPVKLTKVE
jgi:hypothetical protein